MEFLIVRVDVKDLRKAEIFGNEDILRTYSGTFRIGMPI